ncbi:bifunctional DNA-formamidopyrimidine glycosylase/DNA-(apurinic or apyrimidinic site) lyase [Laribacter hongkongensis]|uniref:bifunctional DNA-formamidopyrimidine glycosylase/DNA-(apurinic or apyrimidinic site) lyase n=1 Tax=Laribacter hongkongensis TaxID=168471 RepID=UPI001EFE6256|nr:bifunctional DNA-formamidopyrimidine glycosylase/DNA-(apurinic or apyrimidinic site) lyase [Laribacter hongkongensis]MCG9093810.1 bifunctional DNA-formamidopyrimidine glycosylase/DNA-(apurinic or apyrimidinic site) lyase [Laribacter hongkongensis]
MPELPEVETVRAGLTPHLTGRQIKAVTVREPRLRWPVDPDLSTKLAGLEVRTVERRAKYLLIGFGHEQWLIVHLGMSGSVRVLPDDTPPQKHDHLDFILDDGHLMRYHDPRRFGAVLWHLGPPESHPLLSRLGPEPLSDGFDAAGLLHALAGRRQALKVALMDNAVVVGVGNIYANESLFEAGLDPRRPALSLTADEAGQLVQSVKHTLARAIAAGGSTLRDFRDAIGKPGYFQQDYAVYGRQGQSCPRCGSLVERCRLGQRSTFFCPACQR